MTTLATLRTRARSRADMPSSTFVTDAELNVWLNEGIAIIHDKLALAYGGDFLESTSSFTTDGTEYLDLPGDFYKLLGIDLTRNGITKTLEPFAMHERNALKNLNLGSYWADFPKYKLSGADRLRLLPAPTSGLSGTIWYIPTATVLSNDADTVSFPNGWERYAVVYAAIQMLSKEESDTKELRTLLAQWDAELLQIFESRDSGVAHSATDVEHANTWNW